ncbi:MAG: DUF1080 domain-containing protein [Planctomycetaceae bacterium]|jgi:hypothetical protein|nr:DUF1080 domain-containing protein [Planctomycetaceae bacterium]
MKKVIYFCFCFMFVCHSFLMAEETVPNVLSPEEKAEGFQLLFDGKRLSPEIWQCAIEGYPVEEEVLVCRQGGNLLTVKEYGDFVLRFEFLLSSGGNNGVGIRAESPTKDAAYHGMEIQILDNSAEKWKGLKPYQFHGSIYGVVPVKRNAEKKDYHKPVGEWNVEEITASGSRIKVVLNGETVVDADISVFKDNPTPDGKEHPGLLREKGFLGFLGHGDPIRFRNIRVKELNALTEEEKKDGFELLFDGKTISPEIWKNDIQGYPVEHGEIVCRKGGTLATIQEYDDFDFRFEFLLPPGGNNGVLVRGGTEIQILDHFHERYKDLKPYQYHGSIYYSVPSKRVPEKHDFHKPVGQWNYEEIIVRGTRYKVILNNETILEADVAELKGKPSMDGQEHPELQNTKGSLGFLGHGDPVQFRNIRVKKLNVLTEE